MADIKNTNNKICGVGCDVVNCKFHSPDNGCHADCITVQSANAMKKAETFCSTFAPKTSM